MNDKERPRSFDTGNDPWYIRLLHKRTLLVLSVLVVIWIGVLLVQMSNLASKIDIQVTQNNAALLVKSLENFRTLYTSEVVARVKPHGIKITNDYEADDAAIPLPATLSMMLGKLIGEGDVAAQASLYSDYPFPLRRQERGPLDLTQKEVIKRLRQKPDKPVIQIVDIEGRNFLRFAKADVMRQNCINCHNTHPDSPKTDWEVGDVRGVLEVILPLDTDEGDVQKSILATLALMIFLGFLGLTLLAFVLGRLKKATTEANQFAYATRKANEDLEKQIVKRKRMESALSATEEHNRLIIEGASDAVVTMNDDGQITGWNPQAEKVFGWASEEAIGHSVAELIIPEDQRQAHEKGIKRFLTTGFAPILNKRIEVTSLHRKGHTFPVELTVTSIKKRDTYSFCAFIRDITASKKIKEKIKSRQEELERLNRVMVGREKKMMELKNEIIELRKKIEGKFS